MKNKLTQASVCTGLGAAELAASWLGWENVFMSEIDDFCRKVLKYHFPNSKLYGDFTKEHFYEYRGLIDVFTAGFPCQPFSVSGDRRGADDHRYLWPQVLRLIKEIRPTWFIGENVAGLTSMVFPGDEIEVESQSDLFGESDKEAVLREQFILESICRDLEQIGYSVQPFIVPACAVGAPHRRDRIWIVANTNSNDAGRCGYEETGRTQEADKRKQEKWKRVWSDIERIGCKETSTDSYNFRLQGSKDNRVIGEVEKNKKQQSLGFYGSVWDNFPTQSPICSRNDGISSRLDGITFSKWRAESIKGYGNAIVPQVIYQFFEIINRIENNQY